jgi:uncharacterized membrane protein
MKNFFRTIAVDILVLGIGLVLSMAAIIYAAKTLDAGKAAIATFMIGVVTARIGSLWLKTTRFRAYKKE